MASKYIVEMACYFSKTGRHDDILTAIMIQQSKLVDNHLR
jgi:hypothetical protein